MIRLRSSFSALAGFGASLILALAGNAQVYVEVGDAGQLPATAQLITGAGPLTGISGELPSGDVDMFGIHIDGGLFTATVTSTAPGGDPQLFLFTAAGFGVFGNDDKSTLTLLSEVTGPLPVGDYFLAISQFDNDPRSAANSLIFPQAVLQVEPLPGAGAVTQWSGSTNTGFNYAISLVGASRIGSDTGVPGVPDESSSLMLLSLGVLALLGIKRRAGR